MGIKYVSFDLYNTLIKRIFSVEKLYQIMESCLIDQSSIKIENFSQRRIEAEKEIKSAGKICYTLNDIYNTSFFKSLSDTEKQYLIRMEEEYEINNTIPNYAGKRLYERYRNFKKICISDMYLDTGTIRRILHKNGYKVSNVYVSCDNNASKKEKELYVKVLEDLKISPNELMHIGDAIRSDYINSQRLGIHSKLVVNRKNNLIRTENYYYDLGFNILGPILYEFCLWIRANAGDCKVLFLSREGEFIKKCYDKLFQNDSEILYVSRRAVIQGTLKILFQYGEEDELRKLLLLKESEDVEHFLKRVGLNKNQIIDKLQNRGINLKESINKKNIGLIWKNRDAFLSELEEANTLFDDYLNSVLEDKNVFVDIGWKGSMQKTIETYLSYTNNPKKVKGLYLGVMDENHKQGFLFSESNNTCKNVLCFSGLLETVLMPNHGSVLGYVQNGAQIVPQFDNCEFDSESENIISNVQKGILDLIETISFFGVQECFDKKVCINKLLKTGCFPSHTDIKKMAKLYFYDNGCKAPLVEKLAILDLIHIKTVKEKIIFSRWKTAFLKQMFILPLPYNWLINFMRGKRDKTTHI